MELSYEHVYAMNKEHARRQLVQTSQQTGSIAQTARLWQTSRQVVRKWVRRFHAEGAAGLADRSRQPHCCPQRTPTTLEEKIVRLGQQTGFGRERLSRLLWHQQRLALSPNTIRHILRRNGLVKPRRQRPIGSPAHSAALRPRRWEGHRRSSPLGPKLVPHLTPAKLPRYQWTLLEGRTRLRFLAFSHQLTRTNALCFAGGVLFWRRAHELQGQTAWGSEWGGESLRQIERLNQQFFQPLGAQLVRFPLGRKGYNGRGERSHRIDGPEVCSPGNIGRSPFIQGSTCLSFLGLTD